MANQKSTDFRRMTAGQVAPGDLFAIVDVSEPTTPTGENKTITANEIAGYFLTNYTATGSRFTLSATVSSSNYLAGGGDFLPDRYVLSSVTVATTGKPLISIGTSPIDAPVGASITGSWNDNRVYPTSCSYDVNYLDILNYGSVNPTDRKVWIQYYDVAGNPTSTGAVCTFTFDGFTR